MVKDNSAWQVHRGSILHFPKVTLSPKDNYEYWNDGVLVIVHGRIQHVGDAKAFFAVSANKALLIQGNVVQHRGLLIPGMIDSHVHFPQVEIIASYGKQLLDWLNTYTFPTELRFSNYDYAKVQAQFFLQQLFAHGTTTASVYATVHPQSVDAFFEAAEQYDARMVCGKVMMDRFCPDELQDTPESSYRDSKALIERWHNQGRALYAITPRFAPTSTPQQLAKAGQLADEHPDIFIQTHLSENINEVAWVKELYPHDDDYLGVYERNHLVRDRALFGHAIHLSEREQQTLASSGASIAFCPSSNLFLGSGLFPYDKAKDAGIPVSIASDVGGGTSLSLLRNQADAYKICQLQGVSLDAFESLYLCTQGAAASMGLDHLIGNFNIGTEADFIELDLTAFPMLKQRTLRCQDLSEQLFALITLGDERVIERTYVHGKLVYQKDMLLCGHNSTNGLRYSSNGFM
ncbi:guanine deaminase [Vibrio fluvialis]|uniref:guanine deaminase n=1 Tax=Vibrio fluvialis TaxID=676 RepID=UPI001C9CDC45|nr:guanine deaminase [Vibrio fluvialis]ELD1798225.1 guanine deaminase [Vibrio fluvialis]MBY7935604.1 guanine deaminase [Vibrio fluvialis]MCE7582990.1 guanine deaminase [Vibrio fluvialis]